MERMSIRQRQQTLGHCGVFFLPCRRMLSPRTGGGGLFELLLDTGQGETANCSLG